METPTTTLSSKKGDLKPASHPSFIAGLQTCVRSALGAGIATALAEWLGLPYPLYAMISAVIVTDISPSGTRKLGVPRMAGTIIGATLGATFCMLLPHAAWSIGVGIFVVMLLSYVIRLQHAAKLAGYTCGIVMLSFGDHPWSYALDRLIETSLGISVAIAVSMVPKLIKTDDAT